MVGTDNKVTFSPVTIAKDNGDVVELSSGVKPGDRVALNISNVVADGDEVNVVDDTKSMLDRFAASNQSDSTDVPVPPPSAASTQASAE